MDSGCRGSGFDSEIIVFPVLHGLSVVPSVSAPSDDIKTGSPVCHRCLHIERSTTAAKRRG